MKLSLVITVLNEEKTISRLIESVVRQSTTPDEVIIVDGGSTDGTVSAITKTTSEESNLPPRRWLKLIVKKGNRAVGRNEAIRKATGDIILSADAGCTLDKNWVKNIIEPFSKKNVDVVAGYYRGVYKNIFQKSLIPYVLVMEDKIKGEFLPATRSMALRKSVWKKIGGFDEKLSHNEDYAFANKLKEINAKIVFAKKAIVNWIPRKNLKESFVMFFRFALGDIQASLYREKVVYLFLRYTFGTYLILLSIVMRSVYLYGFVIISFFGYIFWSVWKNYMYVKNYKAFIYLPLLQFTSDIAVLSGTTLGLVQKISIKSFISLILYNKGVLVIILIYILTMIFIINYGIPNQNHPFTYFMDEWHQSQSVRNLFKYGTPNIAGSANGSIFQFFLTGIYLIPFQIFGVINLFAIKSSVINLDLQFRLFEILRLNTLLFGVGSVALFSYIAKKYYKLSSFLAVFLFTINPIWLMLSNYFKYDIALMFWILVSLLFLLRYINTKSNSDFMLAGFFSGLAFSAKLSAIPLLPIYILAFFLFTDNFLSKFKYLFAGITLFIATFMLFGIPDILLGKGSLAEYLTSNLTSSPNTSYNFILGMDYFQYLVFRLFPSNFGHALYFIAGASIIFLGLKFLTENANIKNLKTTLTYNKNYVFLVVFFGLFAISLYPLKLGAGGNRALVILPFIVILLQLFITKLFSSGNKIIKFLAIVIVVSTILIQAFESFTWLKFKIDPDPRIKASEWILSNVSQGSTIGIENIPIYQLLPDIIVKEFYLKQYGNDYPSIYKYEVINSKVLNLPKTIILTNDEIEKKYVLKSEKKDLVLRLNKEGYKKIMQFKPDFKYFKVLNNEFDFYMSGFAISPNSISVFSKN
ncbi:MAG: glycosyltransferase [Patescibacteria group bacterium]